jgi:putative ABC transport system permease protein
MKFLRLIIRNAGRNKRRTILTVLSVAVAVFLLATMRSVGTTLDDISKPSGAATRLIVQRTTSLADAMPEAFEAKIKQVPGVAAVCPANWFGGTYIENKPEYAFAQFYVDPREIFDVHTEWQISPEEKAAFQQERAAAFCGKKLADKFGWKLGDVIELQGTFLPVHPQLTLRGIYTVPEKPTEEDQFLFHRPYVEEAMNRPGLVGTFRIRLQTSADAAAVSEAVDQLFYNSSAPTKTQTEAAFAASFVSMLGNVKTLITAIGAIVVFTIVLIAANSMAMTARERFTEIAVMKALGCAHADRVRLHRADRWCSGRGRRESHFFLHRRQRKHVLVPAKLRGAPNHRVTGPCGVGADWSVCRGNTGAQRRASEDR